MNWTSYPLASELLASCALNPPARREPKPVGGWPVEAEYDRADERVQALRKLQRAHVAALSALGRIFEACDQVSVTRAIDQAGEVLHEQAA